MKNYAQARKNMIDCQLEPNGITVPEILSAFETVPREKFLPKEKQGLAYLDEDMFVAEGQFLLEPVVFGRMIQAARPGPDDAVLNIGDDTGYSSAVLSNLVSTVVTLEAIPGTLDRARKIWDEGDYCNIAVISGKEREGCPAHAPYNLIFINGAVSHVPEALLKQLAPHSYLVCVLREKPQSCGQIVVIEKIDDGKYSTRRLYDASTPYATGFEPAETFSF